MERKTLVLVACGKELYRKYLLEQIASEYHVWLISTDEVTWQKPLIQGSIKVSDYAFDAIVTAVDNLKKDFPVHGLICWDERFIMVTADVAGHFGLASAGKEGIRGCRDKSLSRQRLSEAGLLQPKSRLCHTLAEAQAFADAIRYPLVVKPRGMGGSIGVALVKNPQELILRFNEADAVSHQGAADFQNGAVLEEYIDGPEISVDGKIIDGCYQPMFVARKRIGLEPHFEELGHTLSYNDPLLSDENLLTVLASAHQAIEFKNGVTHTELKITPKGFLIIEINGRLGGDLIPWLATLAMGIAPGLIAGRIACGDPVDAVVPKKNLNAAISFKYPEFDMTVDGVTLPAPEITRDAQTYCVQLAYPGDKLALPPSGYVARAAYSLSVFNESVEGDRLCRQLLEAVTVTGSPLTEPVL
ncbi:ATP-grasp domain-containing protein [Erwinia sp. DT-104]|uniref:ATP-grasp domain-containing protein n=1 Tax=Erwinia sp. DT-104 TaxID=3396161 RepID=UPI003F1C8C46